MGPLKARPAATGATAATGAGVLRRASRIPATAKMGPMLMNGLLGATITARAVFQSLDDPRSGLGVVGSFELHLADYVLRLAPNEIRLKIQTLGRGRDPCPHDIIGHGQDARANP